MLGVKLQAQVYDILPRGERCRKAMLGVKLKALVYDILPRGERCRKAMLRVKLHALVYDIVLEEKDAGKRCSECASLPSSFHPTPTENKTHLVLWMWSQCISLACGDSESKHYKRDRFLFFFRPQGTATTEKRRCLLR